MISTQFPFKEEIMLINIKKAETIAECEECNQMLCELIKYEIAFDESIAPRTNISDHYERILNKDDAIIFCAECDNKSAGYVAAYKNTPKNSKESCVVIMNLFIKPEFRRLGLGKALISEVEKWAHNKFNISLIELDCFIDNKSALQFYSSLDFKPIRVKMRKRV